MRKYVTAIGIEFDLDDLETYANLPQTVREVRNELYRKIGYANLYVLANNFDDDYHGGEQMRRIKEFVEEVACNFFETDLSWWQEQLFLFSDEIENMC